MTYFRLTKKAWYLMQGGTELYLDKADLTSTPATGSYKIKLPKHWFRQGQPPVENKFLPGTLQIKLDLDTEENQPLPFREPQVGALSIFSIPVNKDFYNEFKGKKNLPELLNQIYSLISKFPRSFPDNFLSYIFIPPSHESLQLKFPYIAFTKDISQDEFKNGLNDPSLGEVLLWVTWLMGLTPRPCLLRSSRQNNYQGYLLNFIPHPQPELASQPTTMATLEKAFNPFSYEFSGKPKMLAEVLASINKEIDIQVNALPSLSNQSITLTFSDKVTFTEVMDAIANFLEATWDWQNENSVFLRAHAYSKD
jgi:hypothetical protein